MLSRSIQLLLVKHFSSARVGQKIAAECHQLHALLVGGNPILQSRAFAIGIAFVAILCLMTFSQANSTIAHKNNDLNDNVIVVIPDDQIELYI
jgi:hypothetical protein